MIKLQECRAYFSYLRLGVKSPVYRGRGRGKRLEFVTGRGEDASREKKLLIREVEDRVRPKNYELADPPGV